MYGTKATLVIKYNVRKREREISIEEERVQDRERERDRMVDERERQIGWKEIQEGNIFH